MDTQRTGRALLAERRPKASTGQGAPYTGQAVTWRELGKREWVWTAALVLDLHAERWPSRQWRALCSGAVCVVFLTKRKWSGINLERKTCLEVRVQVEQPCSSTESAEMRSRGREASAARGVSRTLSTRWGQEGKKPGGVGEVTRTAPPLFLFGMARWRPQQAPGCEVGVWNVWGKMSSKLTFRILAMK